MRRGRGGEIQGPEKQFSRQKHPFWKVVEGRGDAVASPFNLGCSLSLEGEGWGVGELRLLIPQLSLLTHRNGDKPPIAVRNTAGERNDFPRPQSRSRTGYLVEPSLQRKRCGR